MSSKYKKYETTINSEKHLSTQTKNSLQRQDGRELIALTRETVLSKLFLQCTSNLLFNLKRPLCCNVVKTYPNLLLFFLSYKLLVYMLGGHK